MQESGEFFASYRAAFVASDVDVLLEHFAFPVQALSVLDDGVAISVSARDEWARLLGRLIDAYRALAVADAEPLELVVDEPMPEIASARVHWQLRREDRSTVYDFRAVYTLVRVDGRLRIAAIAHDELPRLQQAMAGLAQH